MYIVVSSIKEVKDERKACLLSRHTLQQTGALTYRKTGMTNLTISFMGSKALIARDLNALVAEFSISGGRNALSVQCTYNGDRPL